MAEASERAPAATATVSSLKSDHSTEQLIAKPKVSKPKSVSVTSKSVVASESRAGRQAVVWLGLAQVILGALLIGGGAAAVAKGAALARAGAGLWAGCVAVVCGVVGVLAGINDCYGLSHAATGGPLLTTFLALSLLCFACGNSAAVLAATGLQRDTQRAKPALPSLQEEMEAWTPVLTNIALLLIACTHCLVSVVSICLTARRVCPCLRRKPPYDLNTFDPAPFKLTPEGSTVVADEKGRELAKQLEGKLQGDTTKKTKEEPVPVEYGSANSKEKLVTRWLGHHPPPPAPLPAPMVAPLPAPRRPRPAGVRKPRKPPQMVLVPAHPASTLGRVPPCVMVGPRYATLPLPPAPYGHHPHPHPHPHLYYPVHDTRARRRRSPREHRERRRREGRDRERERESQLTRSLERIHRKRRAERDRPTDADLQRTYTGLDRTYAEQFIAVCDESRHAAERHDSLGSTTVTSDSSHTSRS